LSPFGRVQNLDHIGQAWSLPALKEAVESLNNVLDTLPHGFFKGANPMIHGPEILLGDFYQGTRIPRLKPPQRHVVPVIHHVYRLFRASSKLTGLRDVAIRLMRDFEMTIFVDPSVYPVQQYGIIPLVQQLFLDSVEDIVFVRSLIEYGDAPMLPYIPPPPNRQVSTHEAFGMPFLSMIHNTNCEIFITKTLFVVSDAMRRGGYGTIEEAIVLLQQTEADGRERGIRGKISVGDFHGMFYSDFGVESSTWTHLREQWDSDGASQHVMRSKTNAITEDVSYTLLKSLLAKTDKTLVDRRQHVIDINEVVMRWPFDERNVWHHMAILQFVRCIDLLFDTLKERILMDETRNPTKRSLLRYRLQKSLLHRERFAKRTPLLIAASHCQDRNHVLVKTLLDVAEWSGLDMQNYVNNVKDDFGNSAQMYFDGTYTFYHLAPTSELVTAAGYSQQVNRFWRGPTILSTEWEMDWENGGGWEQFSKRPDLDLPHGHCDIQEVQGLPSMKELVSLINKKQPVVLRGALKDLKVARSMWSLENILKKYGDVSVSVGLIPYLATFAANLPQLEDTSSQEYNTIMREYIHKFRRSGDNFDLDDAPVYLFTSDIANENPTIYDESIQGLEYIRNVTGMQHIAEGQFFIGEAATGAPVHWHNSAINFLWYGRKRWVLFEPDEAFYSVKTSLAFFTEDLPDIRSDKGTVLQAAGKRLIPREFVQEAGDIVLLPDYWGHGTLNLEASVGIAFEHHSLASKMFQTSTNGYTAMALQMKGKFEAMEDMHKRMGNGDFHFDAGP
jgi:hypothetical protein